MRAAYEKTQDEKDRQVAEFEDEHGKAGHQHPDFLERARAAEAG